MAKSIIEELKGFGAETLTDSHRRFIRGLSCRIRSDLLMALQGAGTGHPGGSLSSVDIYAMLWLCANVRPNTVMDEDRDRIIISHGHTAAGIYAVLGNLGYCSRRAFIDTFRKGGSDFEGHPGLQVPGVEWCSGSLGQGLSVGCGLALASRLKKQDFRVFVVMGDGEQAKGQLQEAREFASKFRLGNLTAIVDCNGLQACGQVADVMPQNIAFKYESAGWQVLCIDGHDYEEIYQAIKGGNQTKNQPTVILAKTIMGKGVASIENNFQYHGKMLTSDQYEVALQELGRMSGNQECGVDAEFQDDGLDGGLENDLNYGLEDGRNPQVITDAPTEDDSVKKRNDELEGWNPVEDHVRYGNIISHDKDKPVDCRSAFGEALCDLARENKGSGDVVLAALDCDLAESVKLLNFSVLFPESFIECGIQEHNAVTVAGALSKAGILTFFSDFAVFGIDETYGQHRMNDLNRTSIKLICTHCGLDVGEDGKTHQCIDYIGVMSNLFGYKLILPADANQTDRVTRYAATHSGNIAIMMGRSKVPILLNENGNPYYDAEYRFEYGKADWIRNGSDATIITYGHMVARAVKAYERLRDMEINVGILNVSCPMEPDVSALQMAAGTGLVITYEDHILNSGLGSIVGSYYAENDMTCRFRRLGITRYGISATPDEQYRCQGLDVEDLVETIRDMSVKA